MFKIHIETINAEKLLGYFKSISIADKNYKNWDFFYNALKIECINY